MKTKKLIFGALFSLIAVFAMTTSFERETISFESEIVEAIAGSGGEVTCTEYHICGNGSSRACVWQAVDPKGKCDSCHGCQKF